MEKKLGMVLQSLRKEKNLTAKNVSDLLKQEGYDISDKTISGYETGIRMPNADTFMALCKIYDCKNILQKFNFVKADYLIPTDEEWKVAEKYSLLDDFGKQNINNVLKREQERMEEINQLRHEISELKAQLKENTLDNYSYVNAAHAEDYENAPEELKNQEEDIMDAEDF